MQIKTNTKEDGKTVLGMVRDLIAIIMEISIEVFGCLIKNKVKENYKWKQAIHIMDNGETVRSMDSEDIHLQITTSMRVNLLMAIDLEKVVMLGLMEATTRESGSVIR
jgi:hypothetical protein